MKKTRLFVFAAMLAAASVSCQKDENFESQSQPEQSEVAFILFELSARTENSEMPTRLSLGKELKPAWEEGDQLGVYDGVKIQQFDLTDLETSTFTGSLAEGATQLNAIYPYGAATAFAGGKFTASIPAEQVIEQGDSLATGALLAMAHPVDIGDDKVQFAFKNVCGLIRFEISKAGQVKEFIITGNKGEKFAGEGVIGFETRIENEVEKQVPVFAPSENAATVVKVRPAGENATFAKGTYYAAVAPVTFAEGFSVTLLTVNDAATVSKGTEKEMTVPRNSGMGLRDLVSIAEWDWKIYTVEQLLAWNAAPTSTNHRVELMADLDMTGVEWTPKTFQGVFEGNDHKIYNFTINRNGHCGFVEYLNKDAVIRNLILGSEDGENYDGISKFTYTPGETAGSWVHVGSVAAKVDGNSLLENVTNFIHLETPDSEGTAKVCMGGITSMGASKETIRNCVNYGNVTCNASKGAVTGASNHQLGGIISKTDGSTQVIGCKNYGTITAGGAYVDNIGGIIANPNGNGSEYYDTSKKDEVKDVLPLIKDCYNYGDIVVTKATSEVSPMSLGGITAALTGVTIQNCHNQGNISSVCDVLSAMGGVAGRHVYEFESKVDGCTNGVRGSSDKGILSFSPANGTQQAVLGGILGYTEGKGTLTLANSINNAPFSFSYKAMRSVGGVCGAVGQVASKDGAKTTIALLIDKCHNYGAITIGGTASYSSWQRQIGGIVGMLHGSDAGVKLSSCTNNAAISTTASSGGENRIAGVAGYVNFGNVEISDCTNNGTVSATGSAQNPRPSGIISVANTGIASLKITGCYNKKAITSASSVGNVYCGGIISYLNAPTTITGCYNQGMVTVTKTGSSNNPAVGGIVGGHQGQTITVKSCHNEAEVKCTFSGGTFNIGGILGQTKSSTIQECVNKGAVTISQNTQNCRVGGIIGFTDGASKISKCQNSGAVTNTQPNSCAKYAMAGGIAGVVNNANAVVEECVNNATGTVTANLNTNNNYSGAGGIVGSLESKPTLKKNRNYGKIVAVNTRTSDGKGAYAGGVIATDARSKNTGVVNFEENVNYGEIYAEALSPIVNTLFTGIPGVAAGGIFGLVGYTTATDIKTGNTNYGVVSAKSGNAAGPAGALAGASAIGAWSGKVGKNVKVNGVLWNTWPEGGEAAWLCPSATNPLTATYVDAPVAQ